MKDITPKPENYEYSKKIKYMDMEFDVVFKIDSNCDLEILCICENGLNFTTKKFNIKNSSLDFELFSELIKFDENWTLEGDITKDNFSIKLFKIIKLNFNLINLNENSEKIIRYLCQKVSSLTKEISELKNIKEEKIKEIPLTFTNGWGNYNSGYATGKIIKKGNEITLSGLIKGTNFSTVCVLHEDCRPKQILIFTVNHNESTMRLDIFPNGNVTYVTGTNKHNWISLDGIHFFAGI
jgi:hypothetical protein